MTLTARQQNLLGYVAREETTTEGIAFQELYYANPPIRWAGLRTVANALAGRGLIVTGPWENEDDGLRLTITPAGVAAASTRSERGPDA